MEPPNQPGQFSAQFIYRWDNSDKLFHFVLYFRFQSEISNIFIQIVIPKITLVLPDSAVPQPSPPGGEFFGLSEGERAGRRVCFAGDGGKNNDLDKECFPWT